MNYSLFDDYFDHPTLTKQRDTETQSVYVTQVKTLLTNVHRYLFVLVPRDVYFVGHTLPLSALKWTSLQTRTSPTLHKCATTSYRPKQHAPFNLPIQMTTKQKNVFTYECPSLPVKVLLLKQETDMFDYPVSGNLSAALETYNTIVNII